MIERLRASASLPPFPIHDRLTDALVAAHRSDEAPRDPLVAHVLGACAAYSYSDAETLSTIMARVGLEENACVRIAQTVDAMFIYSTAWLLQSRCGRVVVLCYRGTEPSTFGNWLGDADIGSDSVTLHGAEGDVTVAVHSGFYRNVRATRFDVLRELTDALAGRSLAEPGRQLPHPMEALYVAGHSLGGAMAILFALSLAGTPQHAALAAKLRAVYTFGQPMTLAEASSDVLESLGRRVFRHVAARDLVPSMPPLAWGKFAHVGREYVITPAGWVASEHPVAQLSNLREIPRSLLAFFATGKRREALRYTAAEHGPHHYLSALRPHGMLTEFGDEG